MDESLCLKELVVSVVAEPSGELLEHWDLHPGILHDGVLPCELLLAYREVSALNLTLEIHVRNPEVRVIHLALLINNVLSDGSNDTLSSIILKLDGLHNSII